VIALNGVPSVARMLRSYAGATPAEFLSFSLSGVVELEAGDFVSVWVVGEKREARDAWVTHMDKKAIWSVAERTYAAASQAVADADQQGFNTDRLLVLQVILNISVNL
jgi:hypothetical protein